MSKVNTFNFYQPLYSSIGFEPIYFGELVGLSHDDAKKQYELLKAQGFYDDDVED